MSGGVQTVSDINASNNSAVQFSATSCSGVSDILVPSCGAWLGGWSNDYGVSGLRNQVEEHETRIGRQLQVVHSYHPVGNNSLSTDEKYFINRPSTLLLANWKPTNTWALGDGSNSSVNAAIDTIADSIITVAPNKILFTVFHEPENDVTGSAAGCASNIYIGSAGTPAEYRAMWQNVRNRFDAKGVNNVVWAVNYMGFSKWDCMVDDLWPGNNLVDWVMYDPYGTNGETWEGSTGRFYTWLMNNSDASHDYSSKPFGVAEWGAWQTTQSAVYAFYDGAKAALDANTYPNLKLYAVFDAQGINESRISYDDASMLDSVELQHYKSFISSPAFTH